MYDVQRGFLFINLKKFELKNKFSIEKQIKIPGELTPLNDAFILNDSIVIGLPYVKMADKFKYVQYNYKTDKISYFGQYPDLYPKDRKRLFPNIYSSKSVIKPDESKFASFCDGVKMYRIYNSGKELEKEVFLKKQKDFFEGQWIRKNKIKYYTCIRSTDEYLYALCQNEHSNDLSQSNPTLEIWDWHGNPIAFLKLDQSIFSFDVTDDNNKIYATSFGDRDKIFLYSIDNL